MCVLSSRNCTLSLICLTRLHDTYILLLKQNLQRMNIWLNMADSRTKLQEEIGPEYDDVKKQLEDHQVRKLLGSLVS